MPADVLVVSPSRLDVCRDGLRAFLFRTRRCAHAVEAEPTKDDGVVFASEMWAVESDLAVLAEEIATWITADSEEGRELEAVVSVRMDGRGRRRRVVKRRFQRRLAHSQ
jgi:hypothetical protein